MAVSGTAVNSVGVTDPDDVTLTIIDDDIPAGCEIGDIWCGTVRYADRFPSDAAGRKPLRWYHLDSDVPEFEIMELLPDTRVLMLTASTTEDAVIEAIAAGATGYLQKHSGPEELAEAIRDVAQGRLRIPDKAIRRVFELIRGQRGLTANRALERMTAAEREILTLFASGRSYAQIAEARGNKTVSVRNAVYRIQDKVGVHSKQELVVWAVRNGLLDEAPAGVDSLPVPEGQ